MGSKLFSTFKLRETVFRNRVFMSPMDQYSAKDGMPDTWHLVHYGSRGVGGASLLIVEATAVSPEGRITPGDLGIWNDAQASAFKPITKFIKETGAVPGIQIAHAGRKASTSAPWLGGGPLRKGEGGWQTLAPSTLPFAENYTAPKAMDKGDIEKVANDFAEAARRSLDAGFEVVEIHMAHGYLLHEFLSPLTNRQGGEYGGYWENRTRLPLRIAREVRKIWPSKWPIFARISCTDWVDGGWDIPQSVDLARAMKDIGIDLIDCSSGGLIHGAKVPAAPGFHVPFSEAIGSETGISTAVVGLITEPSQAEEIVSGGKADAVLLARQLLREPYWPLRAAKELGADIVWPNQYLRGKL